MGALAQGQLSVHHVVPGPVQKCYLTATVGFGKQWLAGTAHQVCRPSREPSTGQAAFQAVSENLRQTLPVRTAQIVEYKSIPGMTVDSQQRGVPPQGDDVEISAEAAIRLLAVRQGFDAEMPLEGDSQAELHGNTSLKSF